VLPHDPLVADHELVHGDRSGLQLDLLAVTDTLVGALAVDLEVALFVSISLFLDDLVG
jgi:hypothetical protein